MKRILLGLGAVVFALSLSAAGQNQGAGPGPHAWGDKDKDGKCDITGQPVGQGRANGKGMRAMGRRGGCRGMNRQNGCCRQGQGAAAQATPAPEPKK